MRRVASEIESTLAANGRCVLVDGPEQAMAVANLIAPEHLELLVADPESLLPMVRHAGAVFCGPWAPASIGDYVAGPSHVLPTHGSARFAGALTADDFTKPVHVIDVDRDAFERLGPAVVALPAEGRQGTRRPRTCASRSRRAGDRREPARWDRGATADSELRRSDPAV